MITYPNTKINLGLNVLRKRPDGYHDIETVFVPYFGLRDVLEIVKADDFGATLAGLVAKYGSSSHAGGSVSVSEDKHPGICAGGEKSVSGSAERDMEEGTGTVEKEMRRLNKGAGKECEGSVEVVEKLRQGITEDGKCMITVAREEGVDWEPGKDLCVKAYQVLDADFGLPPVKIYLEKLSPVGAGLGGGSADAAFALEMLSEMFALNLDKTALASYAARLGSDCAFFVWNRPMLGQGRGEILSEIDIPELDRYELKVIVPPHIHISTAEAYHGILPRDRFSPAAGKVMPALSAEDGESSNNGQDNRGQGRLTGVSPLDASKKSGEGRHTGISLPEALKRPAEEWRDCVENDFERTVFPAHPDLAAIKQDLYARGAVYASLSGTGSALYALFAS